MKKLVLVCVYNSGIKTTSKDFLRSSEGILFLIQMSPVDFKIGNESTPFPIVSEKPAGYKLCRYLV